MARGITLKDTIRESYLFHARALLAGGLAFFAMLLLGGRLFYLQVIKHDHFTTLSQENRVNVVPLPPPRGLIYDRNGILLAENLPTFSLELVPEKVPNIDETIARIKTLIQVTEDDLERFQMERRRRRLFEEVPLRFRLSDEEVGAIAVNRHLLPGVEIKSRLARYYRWSSHTSHVVGYVGRISEEELEELKKGDISSYSGSTHIGKTGVERTYEEVLHGTVGFQQVETNARGRSLRVLERKPPVPGKSLHLSIDLRLQMAAEQAFGPERGGLVAIDPKTGAVLALVSVPGFDPNLFVNGIDAKSYGELSTSPDRPLFNRALRGQYPPGSTVKPVIGLAGLETGSVRPDEVVYCHGYYTLPGASHRYRDWKKEGHGPIVLHNAIMQSCDVYFYTLAQKMGIDKLSTYLRQFGFGEKTRIDIVGEAPGLLPSQEWKRRVRGQKWYAGETVITGIGQGYFLTTPLQLASHTATMANNGMRMQPKVLEILEDPATGAKTVVGPKPLDPVPVRDPDNWRRVMEGMGAVVQSPGGTAHRISLDAKFTIAGKTGTAQVFGLKQNETYAEGRIAKTLRDHALFIAFAPIEDPRIAIAVIMENGGHGGSVAAPIARRVMDTYLLDEPIPPEWRQTKAPATLPTPVAPTGSAPEPSTAVKPEDAARKSAPVAAKPVPRVAKPTAGAGPTAKPSPGRPATQTPLSAPGADSQSVTQPSAPSAPVTTAPATQEEPQ